MKRILKSRDIKVFVITILCVLIFLSVNINEYTTRGKIFKITTDAKMIVNAAESYNNDIEKYRDKLTGIHLPIKDEYTLDMLSSVGTGYHLIGENCRIKKKPLEFQGEMTIKQLRIVSSSEKYRVVKQRSDLKSNEWTIMVKNVFTGE